MDVHDPVIICVVQGLRPVLQRQTRIREFGSPCGRYAQSQRKPLGRTREDQKEAWAHHGLSPSPSPTSGAIGAQLVQLGSCAHEEGRA